MSQFSDTRSAESEEWDWLKSAILAARGGGDGDTSWIWQHMAMLRDRAKAAEQRLRDFELEVKWRELRDEA